jgi:hypothetical protein
MSKARSQTERQIGKRVLFDAETWNALDLLAKGGMYDFQELADEAFRDLLKKHGRPTDLKDALKRSMRAEGTAAGTAEKPKRKAVAKK